MLACRLLGHRYRFRAEGATMRWECARACGAGGRELREPDCLVARDCDEGVTRSAAVPGEPGIERLRKAVLAARDVRPRLELHLVDATRQLGPLVPKNDLDTGRRLDRRGLGP